MSIEEILSSLDGNEKRLLKMNIVTGSNITFNFVRFRLVEYTAMGGVRLTPKGEHVARCLRPASVNEVTIEEYE